VNDTEEGYDYPGRVRWALAQDDLSSYQAAAEFLNFNNIDMVCLQHEYGIFGGPAGSHIVHLLRGLKMPAVTTLHTVLREPNPDQLMVMEQIADLSDRLIVMSELSGQFLQEIFKVPGSKIDMVPHGVADLPFLDPNFFKDRFGVEGKAVLLTFGLLSPNKGIENVIQALPQILSKHKNVVYMVAGATHPHILRREGDQYRKHLQALAKEVGVEANVIFHNRIGTRLSYWTTVAERSFLSKIRERSHKRQLNSWTHRPYGMPCVSAPTSTRGIWSGNESHKVTWKVLCGFAANAWRFRTFSSHPGRSKSR
jgi:glycosyltransferase involved in cell wall biosynthesis